MGCFGVAAQPWQRAARALPSAREPTVAVRVSAPVQALGTGQWQSCTRLAPSPPCHDVATWNSLNLNFLLRDGHLLTSDVAT